MTISASVACDCFDDGLGAPCPVAAEQDVAGRLYPPGSATDEEVDLFDEWVERGCTHEGHRFAWEEIANWTDLGVIIKVLDDNIEGLPALRSSVGGSPETGSTR